MAVIYPAKGLWNAATTYQYLDGVQYGKYNYVCVVSSSLNERPDQHPLTWVQMPVITQQDDSYLRSREDLLQYEDARFVSLIQAMANFYSTRNDQSIWGNFLRAVAMELARLEYMYQYDVVDKEPQYLTPPDIKRKYNDPLFINRAYPQQEQFDSGNFAGQPQATTSPIGYRDMLVALLEAYREGATPKSIQDVIFAYTGKAITVEELYKEIDPNGGSFYDQSDRNAIKVSVNVGGNDPLTDVQNLSQLQDITQSLYGAIDLAKPAHVGLEFTTVFGTDENIDAFVLPRYLTQFQLDTLTDAEKVNYYLIGYVLLTSPYIGWKGSLLVAQDTLIQDSNGNIQWASTGGVTDTSAPTWAMDVGDTTPDGTVVWTNIGTLEISVNAYGGLTATEQAFYQGLYVQSPFVSWASQTAYPYGSLVIDPNSYVQWATTGGSPVPDFSDLSRNLLPYNVLYSTLIPFPTTPGTTSGIEPSWSITLNGQTPDGDIVWVNLGAWQDLLVQMYFPRTIRNGKGIDDSLRIIIQQFEEPPFDPMLYQAPIKDLKNPTTTLASYGQFLMDNLTAQQWAALQNIPATWNSSTTYKRGDLIRGVAYPATGCWVLYRAVKKNTNQDPTTDTNNVYWKPLVSPSIYQAYYWNGNAYSLGIPQWQPNWPYYYTGQYLVDPAGNLQIATTGGTSGPIVNVQGIEILGNQLTVTVDSTAGLNSRVTLLGLTNAPFLNGKSIDVTSSDGTHLYATFEHDDYPTTADTGTAQTAFYSDATPTTDGTVVWKYVGKQNLNNPQKWIGVANESKSLTGEVTNYDVNRPFGLVAPRQDLAWEISGGDTFSSYEMD